MFNNSRYIGYKNKQFHNKPTEAYLFLIKHITKLMKRKRHIQIRTNFGKSGINKTIGNINKKLDTSTKQYNLWNWIETKKQLRECIKINKL